MNSTKIKLLRVIKRNFPNVVWNKVKYVSVGYDHDVIVLDQKIIFRFPKHADTKKLLKGEISLLRILSSQVSISIPAYNLVAKDYSCASYPMIGGDSLTVGIFNSLSESQKIKLAKDIANFLSELHSVSFAMVKGCNIRKQFAPQEFGKLHKNAKKYLYSKFSFKEIDIFEIFFFKVSEVVQRTHKKVLIHGDFSGDHILLDEKYNLCGVIDFTDRAFRDPAFDFVYMWDFGQPFVESVCRYYKGDKTGILQRSKVYVESKAIMNMIEAVKNNGANYTVWYRKFKRINLS